MRARGGPEARRWTASGGRATGGRWFVGAGRLGPRPCVGCSQAAEAGPGTGVRPPAVLEFGDTRRTTLSADHPDLDSPMSDTTPLLIYGAYGYSGELIVREAVERGLSPVLAGRNSEALGEVARRYGLASRAFSLESTDELHAALEGMRAVLHCAGPFVHTALPMAEACLARGVHYLDITGEIEVFQALAALDAEARERGVVLLPGVGFDVVPTDCMAAHLAARLPSADHLALAFRITGGVSRGTATTMAENAGSPGAARRGGRIVEVPPAWKHREIDFGDGPTFAATIPWGDVATAWHSTGIPNVEVYMAMPASMYRSLKVSRWLGWLLSWEPIRSRLVARAKARKAGPSDERREQGKSQVWGEARDASGATATARLEGPEAYTLTAMTAVEAARRLVTTEIEPGFQTPSRAFGADFILQFDGVRREDVR